MNGAEKESLPPEGAPNDGGQGESISESTVVGAVVDGQGSVVPALDAKETSGIEGDVAQHKKTYDIKEDEQKALQNQQRLWEAASLRGKYGDLSTSLLAGVKIKPLVDKSEVHLREERVVADVLEELMAAAPERGDAKGWVRLANKHLESAGSEDKMVSRLLRQGKVRRRSFTRTLFLPSGRSRAQPFRLCSIKISLQSFKLCGRC